MEIMRQPSNPMKCAAFGKIQYPCLALFLSYYVMLKTVRDITQEIKKQIWMTSKEAFGINQCIK